jgi:hypothetical protein
MIRKQLENLKQNVEKQVITGIENFKREMLLQQHQ